jgi:methyl-accepting chemotaxis protein
VTSEIKTGVDRSRVAQSRFTTINQTVRDVADIVAMVDRQTDGIAQSTAMIQNSVDSVKGGLSSFAADARANGGQLHQAQERLAQLEQLSGDMLDRLANCGVRIDDTAFIELAQLYARRATEAVEAGIARREVSLDALFDTDYVLIPGSDPAQYTTRFCDFADAHVRPLLDELVAQDPRLIAGALTDMNGHLPTHISLRCQPQRSDPKWNAEFCRNRRIFMDAPTRRAIESEQDAMLVTYRMELGNRYLPVKNVFVPFYVNGRRWGNFELAYRDQAAD